MVARRWNVADGNYDDPNSWTPTGVPQAGDTVTFANGTATVATGAVLDGYQINFGGSTTDTPALAFSGDATLGTNFTAADSGEGFNFTVTGTLTNNGLFLLRQLNQGAIDTIDGTGGASRFINNGAIASTSGSGLIGGFGGIVGPGGGLDINTATFTNNGTLDLNNGLIRVGLATGMKDGGTFNGTGLVKLATNATFEVDGVASGNVIEFEDFTRNRLKLDNPTQFHDVIRGFRLGSIIELTPVNEVVPGAELAPPLIGGTPSFRFQNNVLTIFLDNKFYADLKLEGSYSSSDFVAASPNGDLEIQIACFAAGTRIATARGEVAAEALSVGDLALTVSGVYRPIHSIEHVTVDCATVAQKQAIWPILIRANALAPGCPRRELYLSAEHAIYVRERLIPVGALVNGVSVMQVPCARVTYYHVELETHDVLIAEGLPAESYLDTGGRRLLDGIGIGWITPTASAVERAWEAWGFATREVAGETVRAVRAELQARWVSAEADHPSSDAA